MSLINSSYLGIKADLKSKTHLSESMDLAVRVGVNVHIAFRV
jgi:hypothetical protein